MNRPGRILVAYGAFLIAAGLAGYLSNPDKAKTALLSGGTFGLLHIAFGVLAIRGVRKAAPIALVVAVLLGAVFVWRSVVTWRAVAAGASGKTFAAALITSMLLATILVVTLLVRARRTGKSA